MTSLYESRAMNCDCSYGCDRCEDPHVPCEVCREPLFDEMPKIRMPDGLVFCGAECALDEEAQP